MLCVFRRSHALILPASKYFIGPSALYRNKIPLLLGNMPPKRKRSVAAVTQENHVTSTQTNPQINPEIVDAPDALRASPDSDVDMRMAPGRVKKEDGSESPLSEMSEVEVEPPKKKKSTNKAPAKRKPASAAVGETGRATEKAEPVNAGASKAKRASKDMDAEGEEEADEEADEDEVQEALSRPPPVNSDYLPLPWKGRLGYVRQHLPKMISN